MADLLKDLAGYLFYEGAIDGEAIDTFCDYEPDEPDEIISLHEYAGPPTATGVEALDRNVQVVVRTLPENVEWARAKIWEIFNLLDTPTDRVLDTREHYPNGTRWGVLFSRQTPFMMGRDPVGRVKYAFNIGITTYRD